MNSLFLRADRVRAALLCGVLVVGFAGVVQAGSVTRTSSWTYTAEGLIESETIEPNNPDLSVTTTYTYDGLGNQLTSVTSGAANASPTAQFVPRGSRVVIDPTGRFATEAINALNHTELRTFDSATGAPLSLRGPNGLLTTWKYDDFGRKTRELRADGTSTIYEYAYCLGVAGGTEACPTKAKFLTRSYDLAQGGTDYLGPITVLYFDVLDREIRRVSQEMTKSSGTWAAARTIAIDSEYNAIGLPLKKSEPFQVASPHAPSATPDEVVWDMYEYDVLGRVKVEYHALIGTDDDPTVPGKKRVSYEYQGLKTVATIRRDATLVQGLAAFAAPLGEVQTRTTFKNSQNQVAKVIDAAGGEIEYVYEPFGNLSTTTITAAGANGPQQVTSTATYDVRGRKVLNDDPDTGVSQYIYNALGELVEQTDAKGQKVQITYDRLGRETTKTFRFGNGTVERIDSKTYDTENHGVGKLAASLSVRPATPEELAAGSAAEIEIVSKTFAYDGLARPVLIGQSIDGGAATFQSAVYEASTSRIKKTTLFSGKSVLYSYDDAGSLKTVSDGLTGAAYWTATARSARGQLTDITYGNGVHTKRYYDAARGFLTRIETTKGVTKIQDLRYAWDNLGILKWREVDGGAALGGYLETFEYDQLSRMTSNTVVNAGGSKTVSLVYDGHGNIISKSDVGAYTYGVAGGTIRPHAVASIEKAAGTELFQYDANGNMTLSAGLDVPRSVDWTSFDMPLSMTRGLSRIDYTYDDAQGRLTQIARSLENGTAPETINQTTYYYGDAFTGNRSERTIHHSLQKTVWTDQLVINGELVATIETQETPAGQPAVPAVVRYMHSDHLASVQAITNASGTRIESLDYDPWGLRRLGGDAAAVDHGTPPVAGVGIVGINSDRGFTGHQMLDDMGLIHMNGRIYDASIARFLSADPFVQDAVNTQSYNRYSYVNNNPLAATDPSGYFLGGLFKSIGKFFKKLWKPILTTAITLLGTYLAPFTMGISMFVAGAINGYINGGTWQSALFGGIKGYLTYAGAFDVPGADSMYASGFFEAFEQASTYATLGAVAATGCLGSMLSGGSCASGAGGALMKNLSNGFMKNSEWGKGISKLMDEAAEFKSFEKTVIVGVGSAAGAVAYGCAQGVATGKGCQQGSVTFVVDQSLNLAQETATEYLTKNIARQIGVTNPSSLPTLNPPPQQAPGVVLHRYAVERDFGILKASVNLAVKSVGEGIKGEIMKTKSFAAAFSSAFIDNGKDIIGPIQKYGCQMIVWNNNANTAKC
ncbi:RHS repeat domain-containing protein [Lacibacterium aquatile]|uniref:RHS repeat domain-containing protein n=2 Tax=Lacibacterium aquatile TaxID=1168082 RepID=A0ABW5DQQ0_9PROT